eukprot:5932992-Amphidinium_carterae.1
MVGDDMPCVRFLACAKEYTCRPDEIIFNNLIMGCIKDTDAVLARRRWLTVQRVSTKIKPCQLQLRQKSLQASFQFFRIN